MGFRIADIFTHNFARLTTDEHTAAKATAFELQANPASPGLQFHELEKGENGNFLSVPVNADLRVIVDRTAGSLVLR